MKHLRMLGFVGLAMMLSDVARAAPADDVAEGKRLALQTCTACHRVAADQVQPPKLAVPAPDLASIADGAAVDPGLLQEYLMTNHRSQKTPPDMPTLILTEREAAVLTAYIVSLRRTP